MARFFLLYISLPLVLSFCGLRLLAQSVKSTNLNLNTQPARSVPVGVAAARSYFIARNEHEEEMREDGDRGPDSVDSESSVSSGNRYLMLGIGTFLNDDAYEWGGSHKKNVGSGMLTVTYRIGGWPSSMDLWFRAELQSYTVNGDHPEQFEMMPIIAFPDAESRFPMYFGGGIGPGVFLRQVQGSGDLAANYVVMMGVRFPYLFSNGGLYMETGFKGLINLLSQGQQEGVYLSAGGVFVF